MPKPVNREPAVVARILLVDDDRVFCREFSECFQKYNIISASGGEEALRILSRPNEIELVILDVKMAPMDGIETLERIRKMSADVRVVMFTGYGSREVIIEALRNRADDFIEKPLDVEQVRQVIEKNLDAHACRIYGQGLDDKIAHVKDFLAKNFQKKITLDDAAKAVCLSPKYLSRIFRERSGMGFNEYKLSLRIGLARKLLQKTGYNIGQISGQLGYENRESFIRQFRKAEKTTPSEYRKRFQSRNKRKRVNKKRRR